MLLQAHLQRIVNGDERIEREYALGRRRTDLLIVWPQDGGERHFVVECKVLRRGLERTIAEGLAQTRGYVDRCGAEAGHLIVFDRTPDRPWSANVFVARQWETACRSRSGGCEDRRLVEVLGRCSQLHHPRVTNSMRSVRSPTRMTAA